MPATRTNGAHRSARMGVVVALSTGAGRAGLGSGPFPKLRRQSRAAAARGRGGPTQDEALGQRRCLRGHARWLDTLCNLDLVRNVEGQHLGPAAHDAEYAVYAREIDADVRAPRRCPYGEPRAQGGWMSFLQKPLRAVVRPVAARTCVRTLPATCSQRRRCAVKRTLETA